MKKIPVSFQLNGEQYAGTLEEVAGAGGGVWHLMVDNFYWGRLRRVDDQWYFDESNRQVGELKDHFVATVIAWYE